MDDDLADDVMAYGANAENQALQRAIKAQEQQLAQIEAELEEHTGRRAAIDDHIRSVQAEILQSQAR